MLDMWPAFPIVVWHDEPGKWFREDNIAAALEHPDRVREIRFKGISKQMLRDVMKAMDVPFPVLTTLELKLCSSCWPLLPDPFLGGSAPRLQSLDIDVAAVFPIRKLLLSASDLVHLSFRIDQYGATPEEIATSLSSMALNRYLWYLNIPIHTPGAHAQQTNDHLRYRAPSSLLSPILGSKVLATTWTTSWPISMPLYWMMSHCCNQLIVPPALSESETSPNRIRTRTTYSGYAISVRCPMIFDSEALNSGIFSTVSD